MPVTDRAHPALSFRSYDAEYHPHTHDYQQIVLPIVGTMEIDVEARGGRLDSCVGAAVTPASRHGQLSRGPNRFLVVDCRDCESERFAGHFAADPYFRISPALRRLVDYIELSARRESWLGSIGDHCIPLLLNAVAEGAAQPSRLDTLRQQIESRIDERWRVADMARVAGVSTSRLHSLFRTAFGQSPNRYLAALRLSHALRLLSSTNVPVSRIAQDFGLFGPERPHPRDAGRAWRHAREISARSPVAPDKHRSFAQDSAGRSARLLAAEG